MNKKKIIISVVVLLAVFVLGCFLTQAPEKQGSEVTTTTGHAHINVK